MMRGVIWIFEIFGSFFPIHSSTFGLLGVHPLFHDAREIHPLHENHESQENPNTGDRRQETGDRRQETGDRRILIQKTVRYAHRMMGNS